MADNAWSVSTCNPTVQWYGVPGAGTHYYTARYGQYWVGGGVYQKYRTIGAECGNYYVPVKPYGWVSEFNAYGQWFVGGAIVYIGGQWVTRDGDYGQTAGRLTEGLDIPDEGLMPPEGERPAEVETPPGPVSA